MNPLCRFCLKFSTYKLIVADRSVRKMIRTVFPTKDSECFNKNTTICTRCLNCLKSAYDFTTNANENNDKINKIKVDYTAVMENHNRCQTCLKPMRGGDCVYLFDHIDNVVPYYEIKEMLDYCSLELNIEIYQCPFICKNCWEELKKCYNFVKMYTENNNLDNGIAVKMELDEEVIKQEPEENGFTYVGLQDFIEQNDDIFYDNFRCKQLKDVSQRQLYVRLIRQNLHEILHQGCKKSRKPSTSTHKYKCERCPKTFKRKYQVKRHFLMHLTLKECKEKNTLFECKNCSYRTKLKNSMTIHMKCVHRSAYVCEKCDFETNEEDTFYRHLDKQHDNIAFSYACHSCSYVCCTKLKLLQHTRLHNIENVILKCGKCDFETREMCQLEDHKIQHATVRIKHFYKCAFCKYEVKKKSSIDRHLLTHYSRKQLASKLYQCFHCKYKVKRKDSLAVHIRTMHSA